MNNSDDDDYFSGDLVLDDKTVAFLDEQESKFRRAVSTQSQQCAGPPAKRQKTAGSWQPHSRTIARPDTLEDMDDLPDVSIRQDGTYGLQDKQRRASDLPANRLGFAPRSNDAMETGVGSRSIAAAPLPRGSVSPFCGTSVGPPARPVQVPSRPPSSAHGTRVIQSPVSSQEVARSQCGPLRVNRASSASGEHAEQLLQQIGELRKKNEQVQADMKLALEARLSKEGEVTILRKRMEKQAQDHLTQIAKLKAAKDEADVKHVLLQRQYEADKERLKTELTFRRHELETSSRKHPVPPFSKNDASQIANPFPSQRQRLSQWSPARSSRLPPETSHHPRFGVVSEFEKPKKTTSVETRDLPAGFQTGPQRPQLKQGRKGEASSFDVSQVSPVVPSATSVFQEPSGRFRQSEVFTSQLGGEGYTEDFAPQADIGVDDVGVDEGTPAPTSSSQEDTTTLALPSQNLVYIIQTHTLQGLKLTTLQLLLCSSPADIDQAQPYSAALAQIFDALGGAHSDQDGHRVPRTICYALCDITELLAKNNLVSPLTAVLNLIASLAYILPWIHVLLLSQRVSERDKTPQLLGVLYHIIQDQLQNLNVTTENDPPELRLLGKETLSLYEALVWWIPDDLEDAPSACAPLLTTLLHPRRPLWFLIKSMRILLWLSTRRNSSLSLLSSPANEPMLDTEDVVHHPQIALACSLLTNADYQGPEADELKNLTIMFFGMLSIVHPDTYIRLVASQELIPSLAHYLHHLVAPMWDEKRVFNDVHAVTRKIHIINHTTLLLHHLIQGGDATLDLRERLAHAPATTYQGLIRPFILTLGRLSYASPPYWLDEKDRQRLLGVADLARAILERVIQGPELDLIWETCQDYGGERNEGAMDVDDEEVEAQKITES